MGIFCRYTLVFLTVLRNVPITAASSASNILFGYSMRWLRPPQPLDRTRIRPAEHAVRRGLFTPCWCWIFCTSAQKTNGAFYSVRGLLCPARLYHFITKDWWVSTVHSFQQIISDNPFNRYDYSWDITFFVLSYIIYKLDWSRRAACDGTVIALSQEPPKDKLPSV